MQNMSKLFVYDLETTGVNHWENGIHQLSGKIIIDDQIMQEFNFKMKPLPSKVVVPEALKVAGITEEIMATYAEPNVVKIDIDRIVSKYCDKFDKKDKFHLMGYNNSSFDNQFFRRWFEDLGDKYFGSLFWSDSIDVMVLASDYLKAWRHELPNFQLKTVAEYLGIFVDQEKLHDARYDITLTWEIYKVIKKHVTSRS